MDIDAIAKGLRELDTSDPDAVARRLRGLVGALREAMAERDAAVTAHAALAAAVGEERAARERVQRAVADGADHNAKRETITAATTAHVAAVVRLDAILRGAPGGYVAAGVVRAYRDAVDERLAADRAIEQADADTLFGEHIDDATDDALIGRQSSADAALVAARTALDAALAAAGCP